MSSLQGKIHPNTTGLGGCHPPHSNSCRCFQPLQGGTAALEGVHQLGDLYPPSGSKSGEKKPSRVLWRPTGKPHAGHLTRDTTVSISHPALWTRFFHTSAAKSPMKATQMSLSSPHHHLYHVLHQHDTPTESPQACSS